MIFSKVSSHVTDTIGTPLRQGAGRARAFCLGLSGALAFTLSIPRRPCACRISPPLPFPHSRAIRHSLSNTVVGHFRHYPATSCDHPANTCLSDTETRGDDPRSTRDAS